MLPEYAQARKAIWDAVDPRTGKRRIDTAFPHEIRKSTNNQEMKIGLVGGGSWQVVGSDNYNSLVGSTPAGVVFSEWSLADPRAQGYIAPILAENNGWAVYIYTARGYNHGFKTYQDARQDKKAFAELLTVDDTGAIGLEALEQAKREYIGLYGPDHGLSFWRQEFYNDWSAANIGAILGSAVERADKSGRVGSLPDFSMPVYLSSDLGFRDTCAWWFWQPVRGGFRLVDYDQASGLDADDWIERLASKPWQIGKIYLPHDARVKTFQSKHSAVERFLAAFGPKVVDIVPKVSMADRINAARRVIERCEFDADRCKEGLDGLRSWSYDWNDDTRSFSREPKHDWASHPGDAFSYGCQVMSDYVEPKDARHPSGAIVVGGKSGVTLNDMWDTMKRPSNRV